MSTRNDVDALASFLHRTFVEEPVGRTMTLVTGTQESSERAMEEDRDSRSDTTLVSAE